MTSANPGARGTTRKGTKTAVVLFGVVAVMTGLAFASAPLYRLFCQVTGYGGTPRTEVVAAPEATSEHFITVKFDANVNSSLPWRFAPSQREVRLKLGEQRLAFYDAENDSDQPVTGTAVFNVTPFKAGIYFNKIDCFCFTEQTLQPGERVAMPVSFYVDPEILEDPETRDVSVITLSYTFYPIDDDEAEDDVAAQASNHTVENSGG